MVGGWAMVDSFCLPETVQGSERIGKEPKDAPTHVTELQSSLPVGATTTGDIESKETQDAPTPVVELMSSPLVDAPSTDVNESPQSSGTSDGGTLPMEL